MKYLNINQNEVVFNVYHYNFVIKFKIWKFCLAKYIINVIRVVGSESKRKLEIFRSGSSELIFLESEEFVDCGGDMLIDLLM